MKTFAKLSILILFSFIVNKSNGQVRDTVDGKINNPLISPPKSGSVIVFPKLKNFVGTWYTKQNGIEITFKLELFSYPFKKEPTFYIQALRGGIKYLKNNVEIYNNLSEMSAFADIGDNGKEDVLDILVSEKTSWNRHPISIKLKNKTTIEILPMTTLNEGMRKNPKFSNFQGLLLKRI